MCTLEEALERIEQMEVENHTSTARIHALEEEVKDLTAVAQTRVEQEVDLWEAKAQRDFVASKVTVMENALKELTLTKEGNSSWVCTGCDKPSYRLSCSFVDTSCVMRVLTPSECASCAARL